MFETKVEAVSNFTSKNGNPFDVLRVRVPSGFSGRIAVFGANVGKFHEGDFVKLVIDTDFRNNVTVSVIPSEVGNISA